MATKIDTAVMRPHGEQAEVGIRHEAMASLSVSSFSDVEKTNRYISDSLTSFDRDISRHLPPRAWDTHVHVFDPANYPYAPSHAYSPGVASYCSLLAFEGNLSADGNAQNIVLVQPSPYGTDNSLILHLLAKHTKENREMRAIAVIDPERVTDVELKMMQQLGVRGIRVNAETTAKQVDFMKLKLQILASANRVSRYRHWKCQLFLSGDNWKQIAETIRTLPIKVIADHQGGMKGLSALPDGITDVRQQPGFSELMALAKSERVFIKISGLYRSSKLTTGGYDDLEPLIKEFAREVPGQLIWASDWPHTGSGSSRSEETKDVPERFRSVDNDAVLKNVREWVGREVWHMMTVSTPARVYL